jgi:hypothetical protein
MVEDLSLQDQPEEKSQAELALEACETQRVAIENRLKAIPGTIYYKVHAFAVSVADGDVAIGYIQEPHRITKMRAWDLMQRSLSEAGEILLRSCLLPESDGRILDDKPENDALYMTFIAHAQSLLTMYVDVVKKN